MLILASQISPLPDINPTEFPSTDKLVLFAKTSFFLRAFLLQWKLGLVVTSVCTLRPFHLSGSRRILSSTAAPRSHLQRPLRTVPRRLKPCMFLRCCLYSPQSHHVCRAHFLPLLLAELKYGLVSGWRRPGCHLLRPCHTPSPIKTQLQPGTGHRGSQLKPHTQETEVSPGHTVRPCPPPTHTQKAQLHRMLALPEVSDHPVTVHLSSLAELRFF